MIPGELSATLPQSDKGRVARHPPKDDYETAEDSNVVRANGQIKKLLRRVRYHF